MNCSTHTEAPAVAFCRTCGKALCTDCRRVTEGVVYCADHATAPAASNSSPYFTTPPTPPGQANPGLAFVLGLIPGVGAIYNGQYAKGLVHAVIWGLLVSIVSSSAVHGLEPIFGILIAVWEFYMAFEAYHTAQRRRMGEPVDEYSSVLNLRGHGGQLPVGPIALIVLGVLLLMHTLNVLNFEYVARYWPVLLIALGAWLLYLRVTAPGGAQNGARDPLWGRSDERR